MSKIDTGGPAFPLVTWKSPDGMCVELSHNGMTLRQYYAGLAMANMAELHHGIGVDPIGVARAACQYADALIAELKGVA